MSKHVEDGVNEAVEGRGALRPRTARADKLRPKRHQPIEPIDIKVHVAFRQCIGAQDTAFLLAEVLRHVMFMRGQLPMPYRQLLETLEKREDLDRIARDRRASRTVDERRQGGSSFAPGSAATTSRGRKSPKNQRPLSKALAHRRACKTLEALEATVLHMEQAFVDAAQKGRTVREALILLGASHLSPRELYTVVFLPPMGCPVDGSSGAQDPRVPDAYSRKLVRCLVGEMWGASLRNLGPCRVHVFLRLAEGFAAPRRMQAAAAVTAGRDSVAGDPIPREVKRSKTAVLP